MQVSRIDVSPLKVPAVEPITQTREGQATLDSNTQKPLWDVDVALFGDGRSQTVPLAPPGRRLLKGLGVGARVVLGGLETAASEKTNYPGVKVRARSVKAEGTSFGLRGAAA